ncbi:MAG: hypothetical protein E7570_01750 [Ruminococcaceae bacterium]|nr:hypothetical protein [Oscillospiraceae bacterium]
MNSFLYEMFQEMITEKIDMSNLGISFISAIILSILLDKVAFQVAWEASPGGALGSIIHYAVRGVTFFVLWVLTYFFLWFDEWIKTNYIVFICYIGTFLFVVFSIVFFKNLCKGARNS